MTIRASAGQLLSREQNKTEKGERKKQRAKRNREGRKEGKKRKREIWGFKVQSNLLMSCTSHCPRKERRKWTRSDSREITVRSKSDC
ncbi:hypothetical protein V6Z11_D05G211500 [Gossypium hirsutum]